MANEKRLIDANALLEEIQFRRPVIDTETKIVADCVAIAQKAIVNAPTVDAVEVVHGRWEQMGEADYKCSVCGFRFTSGDSITMFPYCRCGAKMDGGNDNG